MYRWKRLFSPEIFQGANRRINYFEGWYFKCVSQNRKNIMAFIPGVSYGRSEKDSHAFIQVIDGSRNRSGYFSFPLTDFKYVRDKLELHFGNNSFSGSGLTVSLKNKDMSYEGCLNFENPSAFPKSLLNPGIMGPFGFLPFMECYHGVVYVNHRLSGVIDIDHQPQDFSNGSGYIEKDWGTSFPQSWIWIQCNHFEDTEGSFMLSYAHIPFLGRSFKGLISFFSVDGQFYRFSTYQGSRLTDLVLKDDTLSALVEGKRHDLRLTVKIQPGSRLKAPRKGAMIHTLTESMNSSLGISITKKNGDVLYRGQGNVAGVEIAGDLSKLISI